MHRLELLYTKMIGSIESLPCLETRQKALVHTCGVAQFAAMLAVRRGLDTELAAAAGLLHDIFAYNAGTYEDHCLKGALWASELLNDTGLYSADEIVIIQSAIRHHDDRGVVHSPYDEILKDADILQPFLLSLKWPAMGCTRDRLVHVLGELNMTCSLIQNNEM